MKTKPLFLAATSLFFLFQSCLFASYAICNAYSVYGNLSDSDLKTSHSLTKPAQAEVLVSAGPSDRASSWAQATLDGKVYGFTEGFGTAGVDIYAHSSAVSSADWLVWSDTVPLGTPVRVWVDLLFVGYLSSYHSRAASSASVQLSLNGQSIYAGSARYQIPTVTAEGSWVDSCGARIAYYCNVYAPGSLFLQTAVGQTINLTLTLQTSVECPQITIGGARTDFSSSGSYTFLGVYSTGTPSKPLNVQMILIPEPASLFLLACGGCLLGRNFRK
ncbi:MAG TPA: hypothetical protein PK054_09365 [Anaerohalosphaeraceae bacterium]|nr:hypothetical protein [Anaerohalosphaeraceae bacterium]HOL89331.1 hypothetical protein [Anaerohalosphaeraceae bacterium]HPP56770.1 hypothetical protein [Anaerohalosphaeraceae bacterium]